MKTVVYKMKSNEKIPLLNASILLALVPLLASPVSTEDTGLLRTEGSLSSSITFPDNGSFSALWFWTDHLNTTIVMDISATFTYTIPTNVSRTEIWHVAYFYQPNTASTNASSLKIPSCHQYMTFTADRINSVVLSSNQEVYWMFCEDIYLCKLQPPKPANQTVERVSHDSNYLFAGLIGISVIFVLLLGIVVVLSVCLHRKIRPEHHYEKAFWPTIALPPPLPERLNEFLEEHLGETYTKPIDDVSPEIAANSPNDIRVLDDNPEHSQIVEVPEKPSWNEVTENPKAFILDHESLNSIYGITIQ